MNKADQMLKFFGPNGERWFQGNYFSEYELTSDRRVPAAGAKACLLGGAQTVAAEYETEYNKLIQAMQEVIAEQFPSYVWERRSGEHWVHIPHFNDATETTWEDVKMVLEKVSVKLEEQA